MKRKNIDKVKLPRKLKKATKDLLTQETSVMIGELGTNVSKLRFREGVRLKSHHRRLVAKFEGKLRTAFDAMMDVYGESFSNCLPFIDKLPKAQGILYDGFESKFPCFAPLGEAMSKEVIDKFQKDTKNNAQWTFPKGDKENIRNEKIN